VDNKTQTLAVSFAFKTATSLKTMRIVSRQPVSHFKQVASPSHPTKMNVGAPKSMAMIETVSIRSKMPGTTEKIFIFDDFGNRILTIEKAITEYDDRNNKSSS